MNDKAFESLNKLTTAGFDSNICIDESFKGSNQITTLQQTMNSKCFYEENAKIPAVITQLEDKMEALESLLKDSNVTIALLRNSLKESKSTNEKLQRENEQAQKRTGSKTNAKVQEMPKSSKNFRKTRNL